MYKKLIALTVTLCLLFIVFTLLPVHGEAQVYDSFIRIHVLANSDSEEDQALKLAVRDFIIDSCGKYFPETGSIEDAAKIINENLPALEAAAQDFVTESGYSYPVKIVLEEETYPTRSYESLSFPAGRYLSLKVLIGEAEGENWWCVLFPPLCLGAASAKQDDAFVSVGLTEDQYKVITDTDKTTYNVRFKILETIEDALGK